MTIEGYYTVKELSYTIRCARMHDAKQLEKLRYRIDGETENLDREPGEDYIDEKSFQQIITTDTEHPHHLFLVTEVEGQLVGFARCEGTNLKRTCHKVEFGIGILRDYWGYRIGHQLLSHALDWSKENQIKKVCLTVLEENKSAIRLYKQHGFEVEGVLKADKLLSDGMFYSSLVMGRYNDN